VHKKVAALQSILHSVVTDAAITVVAAVMGQLRPRRLQPWWGPQRLQPRRSHASSDKRPTCQVCKKKGHTTDRCWYRFDEDYVLEERVVAAAATGSHGDANWYTDSGATDHIIGDLEKLVICDKYNGND
jgi:hypothetical protein